MSYRLSRDHKSYKWRKFYVLLDLRRCYLCPTGQQNIARDLLVLKRRHKMCEVASLSYRVSRRTYPFTWKCSLWFYCKFIMNKLSYIVHPVALRADVAHFLRRLKTNKSLAYSPGLVALKTSHRMCDVVPHGYRVHNQTKLIYRKFRVKT